MNTRDVFILLSFLLCPYTIALNSESIELFVQTTNSNVVHRGRELNTCNYDCAYDSDYGKFFCFVFVFEKNCWMKNVSLNDEDELVVMITIL